MIFVGLPQRLRSLVSPDDVRQRSWLTIVPKTAELLSRHLSRLQLSAWAAALLRHLSRRKRDPPRPTAPPLNPPGRAPDVCERPSSRPYRDDSPQPESTEGSPIDALIREEDVARLNAALDHLSFEEQYVVRSHHLAGRTVAQVADAAGWPVSLAEASLKSGIRRLRTLMGGDGSDDTETAARRRQRRPKRGQRPHRRTPK
jgi:RNA polymerase sigma factor (sigma-70 family)